MRDADALEPLLGVMAAAGHHDGTEAHRLLNEAESHLPPGWHKARPDIQAAHEAADAGEWQRCWTKAHHAICGLTWAFPPDLAVCPPRPRTEPFGDQRQCACGGRVPPHGRFCPTCGQCA